MDAASIIKVVTGIVVVPLGIISSEVWPRWSQASLPVKVITGPIVLPFTALVYGLVVLWDKLK